MASWNIWTVWNMCFVQEKTWMIVYSWKTYMVQLVIKHCHSDYIYDALTYCSMSYISSLSIFVIAYNKASVGSL